MSVRKRLQKTANISLWSSTVGLLILMAIASYYGRDVMQLLSLNKVHTFQQLTSFSQSDQDFAFIRSANIVNTGIYVTIDEWFTQRNYYGYIAQIEDKYFLFFSEEENDISSGNLILSKWWSTSESMLTFRKMIVEDLVNSSEYTREEVDSLIFAKVFLNIDDTLEASLPWAVLWGFLLFILMIIFYRSLRVRLGIFSDSIESAVLDYDLGYRNILHQEKHWTVGEGHLIYHRFSNRVFDISQIKEINIFENRLIIYFGYDKVTILAPGGTVSRWVESWQIQRRNQHDSVHPL